MRLKFNKKIEFFLKKNFLPQSYLFKRRIKRSIKNNDEKEIKLLKEIIIPGTDTIDVGVYRGVYSYEMAKYSKIVHAFEPNPVIFNDIKLNLSKIIKNINFYNYALSDHEKNSILKVPIRNKDFDRSNYEEYFQMGKATIHDENKMEDIETFEVKSKKLDNFINLYVCPIREMPLIFFKFLYFIPLLPPLAGTSAKIFLFKNIKLNF